VALKWNDKDHCFGSNCESEMKEAKCGPFRAEIWKFVPEEGPEYPIRLFFAFGEDREIELHPDLPEFGTRAGAEYHVEMMLQKVAREMTSDLNRMELDPHGLHAAKIKWIRDYREKTGASLQDAVVAFDRQRSQVKA
jgi:hypothetical protein